jgi:hypothetical protein
MNMPYVILYVQKLNSPVSYAFNRSTKIGRLGSLSTNGDGMMPGFRHLIRGSGDENLKARNRTHAVTSADRIKVSLK